MSQKRVQHPACVIVTSGREDVDVVATGVADEVRRVACSSELDGLA
jgi:hypothetical protein